MSPIKLFKIIVEILSIIALANGNLVTLDGECPFARLKPPQNAVIPILKGKYNVIAETSSGPLNRTDIQMLLKQSSKDSIVMTQRFLYPENDQCYDIKIHSKALERIGVFDVKYQVAPDTSPVGFTGYYIALEPRTLFGIGLLCHNLPNSKYDVDIAVLSGLTDKYDQAMQERVQKIFKEQNIPQLYQYMVPVPQNHKCDFSMEEIVDSFRPSPDALPDSTDSTVPDLPIYL
ncbi:uncharacterized protein LOC123297413 isoform X1 [Chrysoperla carnea]|uniref:uncharacterized protein LOC123297413 isoform X1 n=1 Tax=Chrysoperla carnea TaxID=189513 RepID=UPI001D0885CA|nr:uncharacterized protein LOC123297413 isoform X1 [Chrysoperla carnea]